MVSDQELDNFIEGVAAELRRPVRIDASFDAKVMAALEAPVIPLHGERHAEPSAKRRPWLLRSWSVPVSPLGAFAVAAGIAAVVFINVRNGDTITPTPSIPQQVVLQPVTEMTSNGVRVFSQSFVYTGADAQSVSLVGDFNDWNIETMPLKQVSEGVWSVTIMLPAGRHEYQFVVDGKEWKQDPAAPVSPENDFGARNSLVTVRGGGQ